MTQQRPINRRAAALALLAICVFAGVSFGDPLGLRVDWSSQPRAQGSLIAGYVFNDNGTPVGDVLLRIEGLDQAGQVVSTSTGYVFGTVPAFNRTYFEVPVPAASAYRVGVSSFQWLKGGAGGGAGGGGM